MNPEKMVMSELEFAALAGNDLAYVRPVPDEEARALAEQLNMPVTGIQLYSLHGADGRRIALTDSVATAAASASEHDLATVRVH